MPRTRSSECLKQPHPRPLPERSSRKPGAPPRVDPTWLAVQDGGVVRLARGIGEGRSFEELPILADALEEAGCDQPVILDHLRSGGPHALSCWALELFLG